MSVQSCFQVKVYLFLVNDFSYGTDHAGSAGTKQSSDPLLLYGEAQLSHGHIALRHHEVSLRGKRKNDSKFEISLSMALFSCSIYFT